MAVARWLLLGLGVLALILQLLPEAAWVQQLHQENMGSLGRFLATPGRVGRVGQVATEADVEPEWEPEWEASWRRRARPCITFEETKFKSFGSQVSKAWAEHQALVIISVAAGAAAVAAAVVAKRRYAQWAYDLLMPDNAEETISILEVLGFAALWIFDMASDLYVSGIYIQQGLYAFATCSIAIFVCSGTMGYVQSRLRWQRADSANVDYWAANLDDDGIPCPGRKELLLYALQVQPLIIAYDALKKGRVSRELEHEKVLTSLCEAVPSSLLQVYALIISASLKNRSIFETCILWTSLASSVATVAAAINKGFKDLAPGGIGAAALPDLCLFGWRFFDVASRIGTWALLGAALRPSDAPARGVHQPYLPGILLLQAAVTVGMCRVVLGRIRATREDMMATLLCFAGIPWCTLGGRELLAQLRLQAGFQLLRSLELVMVLLTVTKQFALAEHTQGHPLCPLEQRPYLEAWAMISFCGGLVAGCGSAAAQVALRHFATCIFPVVEGHRGGPLHLAVRLGSVHLLDSLLAEGPNEETGETHTMLVHEAAAGGHAAVTRYLGERRVPVDSKDEHGRLPVHHAAAGGHVAALRALQELGADLAAADDAGGTPAHDAAENGHAPALEMLRAAGVDLQDAATNIGRTPLHYAAMNGHVETLRLLLEQGAKQEATDNAGLTPLHFAAGEGHLETLRLLLVRGANKEAATNTGGTPLHYAAQNGHTQTLRLLLEQGAKQEAAPNEGQTPLHLAAQNGHLETLRLLLDRGAEKEAATNAGSTPLHLAAKNGHLETSRLLLDRGVEKEAADEDGWTPLHRGTGRPPGDAAAPAGPRCGEGRHGK